MDASVLLQRETLQPSSAGVPAQPAREGLLPRLCDLQGDKQLIEGRLEVPGRTWNQENHSRRTTGGEPQEENHGRFMEVWSCWDEVGPGPQASVPSLGTPPGS